jgi:hypothetical protein
MKDMLCLVSVAALLLLCFAGPLVDLASVLWNGFFSESRCAPDALQRFGIVFNGVP